MRQISFGRFGAPRRARLRSAAAARGLSIALAALALVFVAGAVEAQTLASLPAPSQTLERTGQARPVAAWVKFCGRYPGECAVDPSEPAVISLTPDVWRTIVSVNRRVNSRIKPMTDLEHWGLVDRWDFPEDGYGDCE